MLEAIFLAHGEIQKVIAAQIEMFHALRLSKPEWNVPAAYPARSPSGSKSALKTQLKQAFMTAGKHERKAAVKALTEPFLAAIPAEDELRKVHAKKVIHDLEEEILRDTVIGERRRFDGRALDEVRPITIEVGLLPRTHGSALFTRGETQALVSVTLGTGRDAQIIEEYEGESKQRFLLHYNFPPFSVGEVKFLRGPAAARSVTACWRAARCTPMLPADDEFAYTVRVVSDILESNGSSSMATRLRRLARPLRRRRADAGAGGGRGDGPDQARRPVRRAHRHRRRRGPLRRHGLQGGRHARRHHRAPDGHQDHRRHPRDHGRRPRAGQPRPHAHPREDGGGASARRAPRCRASRRACTWSRSRSTRSATSSAPAARRSAASSTRPAARSRSRTTARSRSTRPTSAAADRAKQIIERLTEVPEVGKTYTGTVRRIEPFGAFVEILPGLDGLLHISELAPYRVGEVRDILKEGDEVTVKVLEYDDSTGKARLSRKSVIMESPDYDPAQYEGMGAPVGAGAGGGGDRGGRDRDRNGRGGGGGRDRGGRGGDRGGRGGGGGRRF